MLSIIVPAHNEAAVIERGLHAIVDGATPGELEVIVACNGCTDETAELARRCGPLVRVIEVSQASKIAALNAADAAATGFPRIYIDADVVLDLASIRAIAEVLQSGDAHFATPALRMDLSQTSWPVRAFYRVWTRLPYNQVGGQVGTGVYAVSQAGRARFEQFPDVINDDGFVRFSFPPEQRVTVSSAVSRVDPPRTLAGLIRAKTRVRLGHAQLRRAFPHVATADHRAAREPLWRWVLARPGLWLSLPVYLYVNLAARRQAAHRRRAGEATWGRDDSRDARAPSTPA